MASAGVLLDLLSHALGIDWWMCQLGGQSVAVTSICLIRHGETAWNSEGRLQGREDIPLNDRGRDQARKLADALAADRWDLLVSSPLRRAWETATIIAARLGLPEPLAIPELMERDYGAASGPTKIEAARRFQMASIPPPRPAQTSASDVGRYWNGWRPGQLGDPPWS